MLAELETKKLSDWFDELLGRGTKVKVTKDKIKRVQDELRIRDLLDRTANFDELPAIVKDKVTLDAYWRARAEAEEKADQGWIVDAYDAEMPEHPELKSASMKRSIRIDAEIERVSDMLADKYDDGEGGYHKADPYDQDIIKLKMLKGELTEDLRPTFGDAIECKIKDYTENKDTNENQRHHFVQQIRSIADKIASGLENGLQTPLTELNRDEIKVVAEKIWPNASTRNTNLSGRMVSVITTWKKLNPKQKLEDNPFSSLVGQNSLQADTKKRRSVTPKEYSLFWANLEACDDPEIRMIGMMIAYAGCPQGETAGCLRGDLKLQANVPHLIIRRNNHRVLGKKRLERCIPLVDPIVDHWREYAKTYFEGTDSGDLLFPKYGVGKYQVQERSKKLKPLVSNLAGGDDLLTSYSQRHAFTDRYVEAGVSEGIGAYLMGHKTNASSKVHQDYGGFTRPEKLVDAMLRITQVVESFGYQEHFDVL